MVPWFSASRKRSTPKAFRVVPSVYGFAVPARQEQGDRLVLHSFGFRSLLFAVDCLVRISLGYLNAGNLVHGGFA